MEVFSFEERFNQYRDRDEAPDAQSGSLDENTNTAPTLSAAQARTKATMQGDHGEGSSGADTEHIDSLLDGTELGIPKVFMPDELDSERAYQWVKALGESTKAAEGEPDLAEQIGYKDPALSDPRERDPMRLRGMELPCGQAACSVADGCPKFRFATQLASARAETDRTLEMCKALLEIQAEQSGEKA